MDKPGGGRQGHSLSRREVPDRGRLGRGRRRRHAVPVRQGAFRAARASRATRSRSASPLATRRPTASCLWTRLAPSPLDRQRRHARQGDPSPVGGRQGRDLHAGRRQRRGARHLRRRALGARRAARACRRASSTSTASRRAARSARPAARRPRRAVATSALAFAFACCQQYEHGYYTAYKHMAQEDLDLVIHVGDYIYEYDTNSYTASGGNVRGELQPRDRQPRRLPRAPRAVQDRPGPAGRARELRVARDVRRPRGRQQLGRRHP